MTDRLPAQKKTAHPCSEALWEDLPSLPCSLIENALEQYATQPVQHNDAAAQQEQDNNVSETIRASSGNTTLDADEHSTPSPDQQPVAQPSRPKTRCPLPLPEPLDIDASALDLTQSQSQSHSVQRQSDDDDDAIALAAKDFGLHDIPDLDDTGMSWTQANPSTQYQRRYWMAQLRPLGLLDVSSASSGDELPVQAPLPKKRKRRSNVNAEQPLETNIRSGQDLGIGPSRLSKPTTAAGASQRPRPKPRKSVALAVGDDLSDVEEVSGTLFFTRKTSSRPRRQGSHSPRSVNQTYEDSPEDSRAAVPPTNRVLERTPSYVLTKDDEEALENFFLTDEDHEEEQLRFTGLRAAEEGPPLTNKVAAAQEQAHRLETVAPLLQGVVPSHHDQSSGTAGSAEEHTEEPSSQYSITSVRIDGVAPMLNELDEAKQRGYWAQLDFAGPSAMHRSSVWDAAPETPAAGMGGSNLLNRAESDSRLPNRRAALPRVGGILEPPTPSSSPLPQEVPRPSTIRAPVTPAAGSMWLPATVSNVPSRNTSGMGLARKTWGNTWKEDGSRVVRGRVIRNARRDQDENQSVGLVDGSPSAGRGRRGQKGRGGTLRARGDARGRGRAK